MGGWGRGEGGGRRLCDIGKDWRIHTQSRFVEHFQQGSNSRNVYVGHRAHLANLQCIQKFQTFGGLTRFSHIRICIRSRCAINPALYLVPIWFPPSSLRLSNWCPLDDRWMKKSKVNQNQKPQKKLRTPRPSHAEIHMAGLLLISLILTWNNTRSVRLCGLIHRR